MELTPRECLLPQLQPQQVFSWRRHALGRRRADAEGAGSNGRCCHRELQGWGLARKGLGYDDLRAQNERLIYCSITGFGQTGPYAHRAGYDALIQAMGGIMGLTGLPEEDGGSPTKIGVGIADVMCGMYASNAILAALHHREKTGEGQYIDISLLDCQVAWLINQGLSYLTDGNVPKRFGNAHPTIVPYETFPASDKDFMVAVGNDAQYQRFCEVLGCAHLSTDPRFATNADRVRHRTELVPQLRQYTIRQEAEHWPASLRLWAYHVVR